MTLGPARAPLTVGDRTVEPGRRVQLELRPARLPSGGWMEMPVVVLHGRRPGPVVWLSAAVHGDEVCGVEIIRHVLTHLDAQHLRGSVLAVPVVNVPGFGHGDRYLPDRRDLNRSFPGSPRGSLASRFAHLFMSEIVDRCDIGLDLHTGSDHRTNLPQIRADLDDPPTHDLARAFGAPVALHARLRDGSLREAAASRGKTTLLYEGGEAWRFDRDAIEVGTAGCLRVLHHLGLTPTEPGGLRGPAPTRFLRSSRWLRSPASGVVRVAVALGEIVEQGQVLATFSDAVGGRYRSLRATAPGIVIGRSEIPVVHRGDAVVHVASLDVPADPAPPRPVPPATLLPGDAP